MIPLGRLLALTVAVLGVCAVSAYAAGAKFNSSGPEAIAFGAEENFPAGDPKTWQDKRFLVG